MQLKNPSVSRGIVLLLTLATLSLAGAAAARAGEGSGQEAQQQSSTLSSAPDFTAKGVDGKTYTLSELLKKGPVLLDFWTTYCKPCMMELPRLQKLWEEHAEEGFTLLGVVSDDQRTAAKIKPTIRSKNFKFLNVLDPDHKIGSAYNVRNYPTSVLIAPDGKIAVYNLGYKLGDEEETGKRIVALLQEQPAEQSKDGDEKK